MNALTSANDVPQTLRRWFVIHFVADILFAIPLLFIPEALFGIGVESLLGRNASLEVYKAMLNLKVLWGSGAVLGIILGILMGAPTSAWLFLLIFAMFSTVWIYYWLKLR
jgi:hypothetical protein